MEKKCKMHQIDLCEGGLQLVYIGTKNVSEYNTKDEIYYFKTGKLRHNTCARGVTEYRIVYGTRVLYE